MRSIYAPEIDTSNVKIDDDLVITGDRAHHLIKVVRIKSSEKVLILPGKGVKILAEIKSIQKKEITLNIEKVENTKSKHGIDLALALPKKEAVEDIIRFCVELGIDVLYPLNSQFSQAPIKRNERIEKIVESAMIQANNPFVLRIEVEQDLLNLPNISKAYDQVIYFSSLDQMSAKLNVGKNEKILLVIGPEAGFSKEEEQIMAEITNSHAVHMNTCIMRAPTAVCAATGYVISKFD